MQLRRLITIACLSILPTVGQAFDADRTVESRAFGIGTRSCAYWQSEAISEGKVWIFGFWSGLNFGNDDNHYVGALTDGAGIVAEVKKVCDDRPSTTLSQATIEVYARLARMK